MSRAPESSPLVPLTTCTHARRSSRRFGSRTGQRRTGLLFSFTRLGAASEVRSPSRIVYHALSPTPGRSVNLSRSSHFTCYTARTKAIRRYVSPSDLCVLSRESVPFLGSTETSPLPRPPAPDYYRETPTRGTLRTLATSSSRPSRTAGCASRSAMLARAGWIATCARISSRLLSRRCTSRGATRTVSLRAL